MVCVQTLKGQWRFKSDSMNNVEQNIEYTAVQKYDLLVSVWIIILSLIGKSILKE
jgi:hypothetical protein